MQAEVSALATLDFDTLPMYQGSITEAAGIIKGNNSVYAIIKSLHGGCQSSCFLVSKKHDDRNSFYVAKVRICVLYLKFNFVSKKIRLLVLIYMRRRHDKPGGIIMSEVQL
jgi:hypothetical protein